MDLSPQQTLNMPSIRSNVLKIAWPVLIELLLGSLFGMVDMMMLGKMPNKEIANASVTAVGLTNQPLLIGLAFIQALNVGATALVSRYLGAKQQENIEPTLKHVLIINLFVFAIPLSLIGFIFARDILFFMGAKPDALSVGLDYFKIIMIGFIFQALNMSISATLRGIGQTKVPMKINLTVNFLNVIGNFLLIYGYFGLPAFGVTGAAISTAFSNVIASILLFTYILRGKSIVRLNFKHRFRFNRNISYNLFRIGIPASFEQLVLRIGVIIFVKIVADLGTDIYATHQIALNILALSFQPGQAFGIAASSLIGKSLGSKSYDLAEKYSKETRRIGVLVSSFMALLFFFFGSFIVSLYTNDTNIINNAATVLQIIALVQPFQSSQLIISGALRGAGDTFWPLVATFIGCIGFRLIIAFILVTVFHFGLIGAWIAIFIDQFIRWLFVFFRYRTGKWKYIKIR